MILLWGPGPLFFGALLLAIRWTDSWSQIKKGALRISFAFFLSNFAFLFSLFAFSAAAGLLPDLIGIKVSTSSDRVAIDVWIGLVVGAIVASFCVELLLFVMTGKWKKRSLFVLIAAGLLAVLITFSASERNPIYFFLVLMPIGIALFLGVAGGQILGDQPAKLPTAN